MLSWRAVANGIGRLPRYLALFCGFESISPKSNRNFLATPFSCSHCDNARRSNKRDNVIIMPWLMAHPFTCNALLLPSSLSAPRGPSACTLYYFGASASFSVAVRWNLSWRSRASSLFQELKLPLISLFQKAIRINSGKLT